MEAIPFYESEHWTNVRLDWFVPEILELIEYLGDDFDLAKLTGKDALVIEEAAKYETPEQFYKEGTVYLYHLTLFNADKWKAPIYETLRKTIEPCAVLDYGCGIGGDGLNMMRFGFSPAFADFNTRCTDFLRWRLARRNLSAPVYDIEKDEVPRYPLVISFDVLEHIEPEKQWAFLDRLGELGRLVAVSMPMKEAEIYADTNVHYAVDTEELTNEVRRNYTIYGDWLLVDLSKLLIYGEDELLKF